VNNSSAVTIDSDSFGQQGSDTTVFGVSLTGTTRASIVSRDRFLGFPAGQVSLGVGTSNDTVTTNSFSSGVVATGAAGSVVTSNTMSGTCTPLVRLSAGSTGSTVENNLFIEKTSSVSGSCATAPGVVQVSTDSTAGTGASYNLFDSPAGQTEYVWADTQYTDLAAFQAATGQGAEDEATGTYDAFCSASAIARCPLAIDSADPGAPGELSTDINGAARVDDTLVPGINGSSYDRGTLELQDPVTMAAPTTAYTEVPVDSPVTVDADLVNPWSDPVTSYSFDFADGTAPVVSASPTATHTYTDQTRCGECTVTATATLASGRQLKSTAGTQLTVVSTSQWLSVQPEVSRDPVTPLTVGFKQLTVNRVPVASVTFDFGDGSAAVTGTDAIDEVFHTFPAAGTYQVTETVTDDRGFTAHATVPTVVGSSFVPTTPARVLDTRNGTGAAKAKVGPDGTVALQVEGQHGVPATGVTAVTLNITATDAAVPSSVTVYASGKTEPATPMVNFRPGQAVPELVTVPVGADGKILLTNAAGTADLVADLEGYYQIAAKVPGGTSSAVDSGIRLLDTRNGTGARKGPVGPAGTVTFTVPQIATGVWPQAVLLNVTAVHATTSSWVAAYPGGGTLPTASNLNFSADKTVANLVSVPVGAGGKVTLYNRVGNVDLVADLESLDVTTPPGPGYWRTTYTPVTSTRLVDTRTGLGASKGALGKGGVLRVKLPSGYAGMVSVTVVNPTSAGYLSLYSDGAARPNVSDLNWVAGQTVSNTALVATSTTNGEIDVYNAGGSVNVTVDLEGTVAL
jgi:hypothetical protein